MSPFATNVEYALLGYLANAVWQLPVVFAAAWTVARMASRIGPAAEHRVWVGAILLEALIPVCRLNLGAIWRGLAELVTHAASADRGAIRILVADGKVHRLSALRFPAEVLFGVALAFIGGTVYFSMRLAGGIMRTHLMRQRSMPLLLEGDAAEIWSRLTRNDIVGRVPVHALSFDISGPVTIGVFHPAILVPVGFMDSIRPEDLESVLAHELAHVRRWDCAKNLGYEIALLAVAWHPIAWFTRLRLAESREMICDALAADATAGKDRYARSLLRLAAMVIDGPPARTLHAIGIFDANSFERRVMSLTMKRTEVRRLQRLWIAAACAVVGLGTYATAMALRVEIAPGASAVSAKGGGVATGNPFVDPGQLKTTSQTTPEYPAEAKVRKDTVDGSVVFDVTIAKDGSIQAIQLKKSLRADYDKSAWDAVRTWRWEPYLINGEPIEIDTTVTVIYTAGHNEQ